MQDFYILQRTPSALNAEQAQKWYYTVEMLGPDNVLAGDNINDGASGSSAYKNCLSSHFL